ncbi:MAG: hypothetical protein COB81_00100 [Flavobacteriaceae bacterium]|nr:MAG: hypothetical protein COB81_00100 [Flavobacteriaceae bacterium]
MYLKNGFRSILILLFISLLSCTTDSKLKIVDDGKSNYEIVVLTSASEHIKNSSEVLQNYIFKISNVKLPISNVPSKTKLSISVGVGNLENDEIQLLSANGNLIISGGSDAAVSNAVYEFLERYLDCSFYAPDADVFPCSKTITIAENINYNYTPKITTRTVHSRLFYDNHEFAAKHRVTTEAFPYYVPKAKVHTFNKFLPEEKYYKNHPEYFALRDGKRYPTQLCLTNPAVFEIVKKAVRELFEESPEASVISVSQNDNQQYCTCDACAKIDKDEESPAGTMIHFVNKIAAEFPNKTISTLAYQYTRKAPKVKPFSNVLITLCSIECDRSGPITEKCTDFADDIRAWNNITDNIRIWDYTTQFTNFLAPFPNMHTLKPNIVFLSDNNAKWIFEQHSNNPSELFELRSYITAKLLWNPSLNYNDLLTEFTNGYYGDAGVFVKKYVDLVHQKIQETPDFFLFLYGDPSQGFDSFLSPELLTTYDGFFNDALNAVKGDVVLTKRVKEASISINYAILEASKKGLTEALSLVVKGKGTTKLINPSVTNRLDAFLAICKAGNVTLMNEMGFTVQEYYNNYMLALDVAVMPNIAKGKKVTLLTKPKKYAKEDPQVLTDGALGGNSFYANWLGFEGNYLEAVIDLEKATEISTISTAFLQVTNHVVFFPENVTYFASNDNKVFRKLALVKNDAPLVKKSKINDIKYFKTNFPKTTARYIKIVGKNMNQAPYWHHAAGLPAWIFADEVIIN